MLRLSRVQKACIARGILLGRPEYVEQDTSAPAPSLRLTVMVSHKPARLRAAAAVIAEALDEVAAQ